MVYSDNFTRLVERIKNGVKTLKLSGLKGSSRFYLVSELSKVVGRPILYVFPSRESAESAAECISFYLRERPPVLLKREPVMDDALFSSRPLEAAERMGWLFSVRERRILLVDVSSLLERVIPRDVFEESLIRLKKGDSVSREGLILRLREMGYVHSDFVERVGEISLRGAILDVFPPGVPNPIRLEVLGDEIHSIRYFSTDDQKSREKLDRVTIVPSSEIILNDETIKEALSYIQRKASEQGMPASAKLRLMEEVKSGNRSLQIEGLLPSFYPNLSTVFDYIPGDALILFDTSDEVLRSIETFTGSLSEAVGSIKRRLRISPSVSELYLTEEGFQVELSRFQRVLIEDMELSEEGIERIHFHTEGVSIENKEGLKSPFESLSNRISEWQELGYSVQVVLQTEVEGKRVERILSERGIKGVEIRVGGLLSGFIFPEARLSVVTERDIFGEKKRLKPHPVREVPSAFIASFSELKPGDYIVHVDFGIGIFRGLKRLRIENVEGDFIQCEYAGGDRVYVPVDKLRLVQRYIGDGNPPRIDRLGHENWKRVVKRVKRAVESVARELLELYARRKTERGFQFSKRDRLFREFESAFPYEETPDQEAAIEEVMRDMESPRPMDRLICGDVGFGKTEVAIRAAFKAVLDGKQVAFLVPTTLLAYQHYTTCIERLKGYPVIVEMLSRFRTVGQEREILKKLESGAIDIIIGTHKLLSDKVRFKDLGLVIIDEEHRFGVTHKEKLRRLRRGVDVLTLSATPIPRTLQLSLSGIRDMSHINTPPEGRQSVETYVFEYSRAVIRDAIKKEIERGGQVFFIHNRIEDIFSIAKGIMELVPEARVDVTHGRMRERVLEERIAGFMNGRTDVLVTTAIVESGLNIPRANTIIVNNAHVFGLADLYQLRGRVGRSEKKAYAYFLIPGVGSLTPQAKRRLKAIVELKELGSGFRLALSDLEIRGAGTLFGTEQSGHITDVGLELYLDMLNSEIRRLKNEVDGVEYEPEIRVNFPAFIPDDYIGDEAQRLLFYKRLSSISDEGEIRGIEAEMRDRFGDLPEPAKNLLNVVELKLLMKRLLIERMEVGDEEAVLTFLPSSPFYRHFRPSGRSRVFYRRGEAFSEIEKGLDRLKQGAGIKTGSTGKVRT